MNPSFFSLSGRHRSILSPLVLKPTTPNDFAPRSSVKHKPAFSPDISADESPLGRKYPLLSILDIDGVEDAIPTGPRCKFSYRDAKMLDRADRARHEALRDARRAEMEEMNARFEARRANRNIKIEQELQRQKERWQHPKDEQKITAASPTGRKDIEAPPRAEIRKTGAALLEQRATEKAEMLARMANRRAMNKTVVVLDLAKRNEMEIIIARQATERFEMTRLREESEKIALEAALDHGRTANMFESCGAVEITTPLHILAAAEKDRRQFETGMWLLRSMEAIQERLRRDCEAEIAEEDGSARVRNVIAMDTMHIMNTPRGRQDVPSIA